MYGTTGVEAYTVIVAHQVLSPFVPFFVAKQIFCVVLLQIYGKIGVEVYAVIVALINANIAAAVNVCIALEAYLDVFLAIFLELIVQAKGSLLLLLEADLDLLVFLCAHVDVDAHLSVLVELFLAILADVNIQLTVLAEKCIASPAVTIGKILNGCAAAVNVGDLLNLTAQNCTWYNLCKRYCGAIVNVSVDLLGLCISLGVLGK